MNGQEFSSLFMFKFGLPSVYHIMLGMSEDETADYQTQLDNMQTDNYDLNDVLKKYGIKVEREAFSADWRLKILRIKFPSGTFNEADLKRLYDYLTYDETVINKHYSVSTDAEGSITDMEVNIGYELYSISIGWDVDDEGTVYDTITFEAADDDVKLDKLRCLAIIAGNENGFADEVFDYVKQYDKRRHG